MKIKYVLASVFVMLMLTTVSAEIIDFEYEKEVEINKEFGVTLLSNIKEDVSIKLEIDKTCKVIDMCDKLEGLGKAKVRLMCSEPIITNHKFWFLVNDKLIYDTNIDIKVCKPTPPIIEPPIIEPPVIDPPVVPEEPVVEPQHRHHSINFRSRYRQRYNKQFADEIITSFRELNQDKIKYKLQVWKFKDKDKLYFVDDKGKILRELVFYK